MFAKPGIYSTDDHHPVTTTSRTLLTSWRFPSAKILSRALHQHGREWHTHLVLNKQRLVQLSTHELHRRFFYGYRLAVPVG
ncbi:hypothetical protein MHAE_06092 [Mycobacterium haemophilum DSM 44634]|nr:hypothetical protein B586_06255 [Mycobacterium haemophilum DSM 44634]